jgi:hypothetical protein
MGEQNGREISLGQFFDLCQGATSWQMRSLEAVTDEGQNLGSIESRAEISRLGISPLDGGRVLIAMEIAWLLVHYPGTRSWQISELPRFRNGEQKPTETIGLVLAPKTVLYSLQDGSVSCVSPGGNETHFYPPGHAGCIDYHEIEHRALRVSMSIVHLGARTTQY